MTFVLWVGVRIRSFGKSVAGHKRRSFIAAWAAFSSAGGLQPSEGCGLTVL